MGETDRRTARTRSESWARLAVDWYDDHVLRAAAEIEPTVIALWPILLAMAKGDSHAETNPTGRIRTTVRRLANAAVTDDHRIGNALERLVEGEFLTLEAGRLGSVEIELVAFSRWQTPRRSQAERNEVHRHTQEARAGKKPSSATVAQRSGDASETQDGRRETGDGDERENRPNGRSAESPAPRRRVSSRSDDEVAAERDVLRARLDEAAHGLGSRVADLVEVLAAENTTGKVQLSRAVRVLWKPIAAALDDYPADAVRYGVEQALAAKGGQGIPNPQYVRKAAAGYAASEANRHTTKRGNDAGDTREPDPDHRPDFVF